MKSIIKKVLILFADISMTALLLLGVYVGNYLMPQKGIKAATSSIQSSQSTKDTNAAQETESSSEESIEESVMVQQPHMTDTGLQTTAVIKDSTDWHTKFAEHFTASVESTDSSYSSPNLSIQITKGSYDSGVLDYSENGKHKKYGTKVAYTIADIYVGDITCLQTAFAKDMYGNGYSEKLSDMSMRLGSILAVNGDSYNNNRHQDNGTIIRNGVIYRSQKTDMETCVLNWDGTMHFYSPEELDAKVLIDNGAYQSWIFGPSLLDDNGKAKTDFMTWDYIRQSHPRTAIGYYEPGHYCLLVVDGREVDYSRGMFLEEEAAIFEQLGCKLAYNLDGGHCSFMTMQDQVVSHPYKAEHEIPDGIFIMDQISSFQ